MYVMYLNVDISYCRRLESETVASVMNRANDSKVNNAGVMFGTVLLDE